MERRLVSICRSCIACHKLLTIVLYIEIDLLLGFNYFGHLNIIQYLYWCKPQLIWIRALNKYFMQNQN